MVTLNSENENEQVKIPLPKEVYVISQEITIAKNLSCCDIKLRTKQLKKLKKWLQIRSASSFEYSEDDLLRLWKGLFYCFWMSDKPLVQEELAEEFGSLINCFKDLKTSLKFYDAFLKTLCNEWFGLDQWRLDKFLMLNRRMLRYTLLAIKRANWPEESIQDFNFYVAESVLDNDVTGIILHLVEIFLDELAKTSQGEIPSSAVTEFTKPFIIYLAKQRDSTNLAEVRNKIFYHLLWQTDLGRDYQDKFEAWKYMGFPNVNVNNLVKIDNDESDSESEEKSENIQTVLDPRAGNVDVFIPVLEVDTKSIIDIFKKILENEIANPKSKKFIITIIEKYEKFANGLFPLGIKKMPRPQLEPFGPLVESKVEALDKLDDELHGIDRNLKKLNKKKRRKILESLNIDEADETNYENMLKQAMSKYKIKNKNQSESTLVYPKKRKSVMEWVEEEIETAKRSKKEKKNEENMDTDKNVASNKQNKTKKKNKNMEIINTNENNLNKNSNNASKINKKAVEENNLIKNPLSEWDEPLKDGEIEYFVSSTKIRLNEANMLNEENNKNNTDDTDSLDNETTLLLNPFAKMNSAKNKKSKTSVLLGKKMKKEKSVLNMSLPEKKKVKIALGKNMVQKPSEYIRQIKNSPQLPYDAEKKPTKSLLKPNQMPSPINPFYKKKIGLQLNDTF